MAVYKFVKELPDDYLCMICSKVLNEPHLTDCCGQHFCQACLEQWFKKQGKKICPHCRSESFSHISYIPLKRKINALEVYCPNQPEGCTVKTELGELNSHKNECGFAKVVCSQGCRKLILRKDMTQHCNNECSKRKIKCKYCGKEDHYEIISGNHTAICEEYPVNCPRECSAGGLRRKNLAKHAEKCPLEVVQCPFNEAGCDATVLRKDLNAHMESNNQRHLMIMMTAYSKLKLEHDKLHSEHNKVKDDFKQLSSQMAHLSHAVPVKLTDKDDSFSFIITSTKGWTSPKFCVLQGYTFCIMHKEGNTASLMLLKGSIDDNLKWPMNLQWKLEIDLLSEKQKPQKPVVLPTDYSHPQPPPKASRHILVFDLSANLERVAVNNFTNEVARFTLPEEELLHYIVMVKLTSTFHTSLVSKVIATLFGPQQPKACRYCRNELHGISRICPSCGRLQH